MASTSFAAAAARLLNAHHTVIPAVALAMTATAAATMNHQTGIQDLSPSPSSESTLATAKYSDQKMPLRFPTTVGSSPVFMNTATSCEASSKKRLPPNLQNVNLKKRMTHVGRFSLVVETPTNPMVSVVLLALAGKPLTAQSFIDLYQSRGIDTKYERFRATIDGDDANNQDISHFNIQENFTPVVKDAMIYPSLYRTELKEYATTAQIAPLEMSNSLWDATLFTGGKVGQSGAIPMSTAKSSDRDDVESLLLFRAHHCMADGVSLGAIFTELADEGDYFRQMIAEKVNSFKKRSRKKSWWRKLQVLIYYWWWGSMKAIMYQIYLYYQSMINRDPWKALRVESLTATAEDSSSETRSLSWVQAADVDELKEVAAYYSQYTDGKITVNDIISSCVSAATAKLIRYHQSRYPKLASNLKLPCMNVVIPVHMQGGVMLPNQNLGNKIGALVCRIPAQQVNDSQQRLIEVHNALSDRKRTPAAVLSYLVAMAFGVIGTPTSTTSGQGGSGVLSWMFSKAHAKASVAITNVRGPDIPMHLDGRRIETILGFLPLPAGVPIGIAVFSYNKKLSLTVVGESFAVPDADLYLSWIVEEYQELLLGSGIKKAT